MDKTFVTTPGAKETVQVFHLEARVQECRLLAALLEAGWSLVTNSAQATALKGVRPYFPVTFSHNIPEDVVEVEIEIDHAAPKTTFRRTTLPVIFPRWLPGVGGGIPRDVRLSYSGFPSEERIRRLCAMHRCVMPDADPLPEKSVRAAWSLPFRTRALDLLFRQTEYHWSAKGRSDAGKIVDRSYWRLLHRSQAVYCPAGDFGWTYRFFESMLAGAVPVVDHPAPYSEGYHTHPSDQPLPDSFDPELLAENHSRALASVTAMEELAP